MSERAFIDHCLELLSSLGPVSARSMFGGHGFYAGDVMVALIAADTLYLKADGESAPVFAGAGGKPFSYAKRNGDIVVTSYYTPPLEAMDDTDAMAPWAAEALAAARRAQAGRRSDRKRGRVSAP